MPLIIVVDFSDGDPTIICEILCCTTICANEYIISALLSRDHTGNTIELLPDEYAIHKRFLHQSIANIDIVLQLY